MPHPNIIGVIINCNIYKLDITRDNKGSGQDRFQVYCSKALNFLIPLLTYFQTEKFTIDRDGY